MRRPTLKSFPNGMLRVPPTNSATGQLLVPGRQNKHILDFDPTSGVRALHANVEPVRNGSNGQSHQVPVHHSFKTLDAEAFSHADFPTPNCFLDSCFTD